MNSCAHALIVFSGDDGGLKCMDCGELFVRASKLQERTKILDETIEAEAAQHEKYKGAELRAKAAESRLDAALKEIEELRKDLERERAHICEEPPE